MTTPENNNFPTPSSQSGVQTYFQCIQALQQEVIPRQHDLLLQIAALMAETIAQGRRILLFGSGHSHMLAEEGLYRAGGLAPVVPILYPALMLHDGSVLSSKLERTPGIARTILERYSPEAGEMLFIFSNSGVNQVPVEIALVGKESQLTTVAVVNLAYSKVAPLSSLGKRLYEVVDYTLDVGGVPGDSLIPVPGLSLRVGPSSTVIGALLWNCLVTEVSYRLIERVDPFPVYMSSNLPGAAEHNRRLVSIWGPRNPHV